MKGLLTIVLCWSMTGCVEKPPLDKAMAVPTFLAICAALATAAAIANTLGKDHDEKHKIFKHWSGVLLGFILGVLVSIATREISKNANKQADNGAVKDKVHNNK